MFDDLFDRARLMLTFKYVVMIMLISLTLSLLFYQRVSQVFNRELERIGNRYLLRLECPGPNCSVSEGGHHAFHMTAEEQLEASNKIFNQVVWINGVVLVIATVGGFYLSGTTLAPIQKTMEEQKRFIADAAHELRTPITALKTSLEVNLMDDDLSACSKDILQENLEDLSRLEALTDSLLKLAKAEQELFELEPVNLYSVVQQALRQVRPMADKNKVQFKIKFKNQKLQVKADKSALVEVFVILFDNAIKYSPQNTEVIITAYERKSQVEVKVADHGLGIAPYHLKHIFDRFYRVDAARGKKGSGGYGLGLSLAKKILQAHHGSIRVESKLNQGTTFILNLLKA
jgi:signal transduction histidine kinase